MRYLHQFTLLFLLSASLAFSAQPKNWYREQWGEYEKAKRFAEAIPLFEKAVEEYPDEAWFYVFIGVSYVHLKRHAEGIPYLEKAAQLAPEDEGIMGNLHWAQKSYYHSQWKEFEKARRFEEALPLFKKAIEQFPQETWFYVYIGVSYAMLNQHGEGIPYLEKAVQIDPENQGVRRNLGSVLIGYGNYLRDNGKLDESLILFKRATSVRPQHSWSYNLYGHALTLAGKYELAYKSFRTAAGLAGPEEWEEENFKANLHWGIKRGMSHLSSRREWNLAILYGELGANTFPQDWEILLSLVKIYFAADQANGAKTIIDNLLEGANQQLLLALVFLFNDEAESSEELLAKLSETGIEDYEIQMKIASVYNSLLEDLDYYAKMESPWQKKVLEYETKSVQAYFRINPYKQTKKFIAPLVEEFCVYQGAGGISFHYGLYGHYSYDLGRCGRDSTDMAVVAIGEGTVLAVISDEPDKPVGSTVDLSAKANFIRIDHGGVISSYVHLRQNSALVKVGDKVRAGQKIAEVGNSGVSAGPHLHFKIVTSEGITLPIRFEELLRREDRDQEGDLEPADRFEKGYVYFPMMKDDGD